MAATKTVNPITNSKTTWQEVDGLLSGRAWADTTISFSFPTSPADYERNYGSGEPTKGFGAFATTYEQDAFRKVFAGISAVTPLLFVEYKDNATSEPDAKDATIRLGKTNLTNAEAWAYYPSTAPLGGDAWFDNSVNTRLVDPGSYTYTLLMHELGHSHGLKHSFENGKSGTVPRDSLEYTVMSYGSFERSGYWDADEGNYPQTLMQYDIAALQRMYGANYGTNAGDTIYQWDPNTGALTTKNADGDVLSMFDAPGTNKIFMTIWDGGDDNDGLGDTFDFSNYTGHTGRLSVDLQPGGWTTVSAAQLADLDGNDLDGNGRNDLADGSIAVALESRGPNGEVIVQYIENVIGAGSNDTIIGNKIANTITGGDGADLLYGAGAQTSYRDYFTDVFNYDAIYDSDNVAEQYDTIGYFEVGYDDIDLRDLGFTSNQLTFVAGPPGTGTLYGNVDGVGDAELRIDFLNLTGTFNILYDVLV